MNFGIKSQLDTSMYNRGGSGTSIGEALGVAQGVLSMVDRSRERKAKQKDLEEEEAVNAAMSQSLAGWDGKDMGDFKNRVATGAGQLLTEKPEAFSKVASKIADAFKMYNDNEKARIDAEKGGLETDTKKLELAKLKSERQKADLNMLSHFFADKELATDENKFNNAVQLATAYGVTPNFDFQKFSANPDAYIDRFEADKKLHEKTIADIDEKMKGSQLNEQYNKEAESGIKLNVAPEMAEAELSDKKSKASISAIDAEYARRAKEVEINKKEKGEGLETTPQQFTQENQIRNQYRAASKDFEIIRDSYSKIDKIGTTEPTAAGDLSLVFAYMKALDPGSVVRESEYATAENARGVPDSIRNMYNKVLKGQRLAPSQRADFVARAKQIYDTAKDLQLGSKYNYEEIARQYGLNPDRVTGGVYIDYKAKEEAVLPKGIQAGESFTHKNGVVITREK